ncbi:MAG: site-specific DNA-methyltransferase [Proteobacteria bacterium]|nr:site-specific DNA-methyltransferase [Desulfocapsa sp.]MBU3944004.1 site-specific DNA-methyltransferase [Pseudomonadota bacterium]MBU4029473.1 site-specific DNA-methyltransferase [Pseudomonadota bacterium]MBU4043249.1 site-specific DNA-methyltransferase [Pseudomonadota bacterium]MBU4107831.1 site-specific DNA-methyltransferase [Pseudomonadota bacterium]
MEKMKMHSPNLTQENIRKIMELFPNCVTEVKIKDEGGRMKDEKQPSETSAFSPHPSSLKLAVDFDQLRQELSEAIVEGPQERYHLNWPGKREALLTANAPIAKTLRPCREESVDYDTTQNLFIEGDNLDALKLLQETYLGKVKMIYIDPPYNTGNDFIYEDDFAENSEEFLQRSNQKDAEGNRLVANTEANGRFHSDWLSMIYPRLKLARNLLKDDGVIFISIDDGEVHNLRKVCDEVFGADRFIATFVWKSRLNKDNRSMNGASKDHEHIICYGKLIRGSERDQSQYKNPDKDPRGDWASANMVGLATADRRPNLHYDLVNPETGINYGCPKMGWRYEPNTMKRLMSDSRILWPESPDGRPRRKAFVDEIESAFTGFSTIIGEKCFTKDGTANIESLFGDRVMDFPKPVALIEEIIEQGSSTNNDVILDFFAGSATTAHAVMQLNAEDGGNRKFIMVQLPEPCDEKSEAFKAGYPTIADISKERIRRAGIKIIEGKCHEGWNKDIGFRVLKVDSSNMADVYYTPDAINQQQLSLFTDNIKPDRHPEDLLFQVLLDWGVELTLLIRKELIQGKSVFFVNQPPYDLIACFDTGVNEELVKELARFEPVRVVFRDTGFASDAVKINVEQIFKQMSPNTDVKTI